MSTSSANLSVSASVSSLRFTEVEHDALLREARSNIVRDAMRTLREQHRVVLALYYFEELSLAQIAPVLGVTESRAGRLRRRALGTLRDALHTSVGLAA